MNILAQVMIVFTTATGGHLPSPTEMETAATQALVKQEIVVDKYLSGIRSGTHDFIVTRVGRKDDAATPVSDADVTQVAQSIAAQTNCKLAANTTFSAPVISDGASMKIDWKPYHRLEFSCP